MADTKPTVGFHDRYANDPEFKKQVDEGRKRADTKRNHHALKESLAMSRGLPGAKKKYY
jgi:hypothetical protein